MKKDTPKEKKEYTPLTPAQIKGVMEELLIQEDSRERVKDILKDIKAATGIKATVVRKLAMTIMKDKKEQVLEENEEFEALLERVSG